jgi:hypothetical protein
MSLKLPKEPSDPKLLAAMEEIKAILIKHDIAAIVLLESETHGEWLNHITPSWSAARMINDEKGEGIRVTCLAKDYPSKEAHAEALRLTSGMLMGFLDGARRIERNMEAVTMMLAEKIGIEHVSKFNR